MHYEAWKHANALPAFATLANQIYELCVDAHFAPNRGYPIVIPILRPIVDSSVPLLKVAAHPMSKLALSAIINEPKNSDMEFDSLWPGDVVCLRVPMAEGAHAAGAEKGDAAGSSAKARPARGGRKERAGSAKAPEGGGKTPAQAGAAGGADAAESEGSGAAAAPPASGAVAGGADADGPAGQQGAAEGSSDTDQLPSPLDIKDGGADEERAGPSTQETPAEAEKSSGERDTDEEAMNGPNIDWQEEIRRGILRGFRNISETP